MTLEQAKALVPDKDYVIYENIIYGYWRWNQHRTCLEIVSQDSSRQIILAAPHECQTLGEYRGCFHSSVLPPKISDKDYSVDVFILVKNSLYGGCYSYATNSWCCNFRDDESELVFEGDISSSFKWCFRPDYLK